MIELDSSEVLPIVAVLGDIDSSNVQLLSDTLDLLDLELGIIVSFERTSYLDSTVLSALIRAHKERDGNFIIVLPHESRLGRIFDLTGLRGYLHIVQTRTEALRLGTAMRDLSAASFSRDGVVKQESDT